MRRRRTSVPGCGTCTSRPWHRRRRRSLRGRRARRAAACRARSWRPRAYARGTSGAGSGGTTRCSWWLVVVLGAEVVDQLVTLGVAQCVLELHQLDEQVVLRVEALGGHRRLPVEREPLLDA